MSEEGELEKRLFAIIPEVNEWDDSKKKWKIVEIPVRELKARAKKVLDTAKKDFPKLRSIYDGDFDVDTNPNSDEYLPLLIEKWFKKWFGDSE